MPNYLTKILFIIFFLTAINIIYAELPPSAYKQMQDKAPEFLTISVISVSKNEAKDPSTDNRIINVDVKAKVKGIGRSAAKLMIGTIINIKYRHTIYSKPIVGPSEIPILDEGKEYPAFLQKQESGEYSPAARGKSFSIVQIKS